MAKWGGALSRGGGGGGGGGVFRGVGGSIGEVWGTVGRFGRGGGVYVGWTVEGGEGGVRMEVASNPTKPPTSVS